jgi:hypothetical protein
MHLEKCSSCGNDYKNTFKVLYNDQTYYFDSLECVINILAPICQSCGCKIIGHGIEDQEKLFCCSHCFRKSTTNANAKLSDIE